MVIILAIFVVLASLFQLWVYLWQTPPGFVYPLVHNYIPDFYWYLSLMEQGREGQLLLTSRFTAENFSPQFVNAFFAVLGWLAGFLNLSLPLIYTLARVIFGTSLLISGYILAKRVIGGNRGSLMAFLFMIFGTPFWYVKAGQFHQLGEFWTGFDPLLRVTFLPHHLLANTLFIVTLLVLLNCWKTKLVKLAILAGMIGAIGGWINPAILPILFLTIGLASLLFVIQQYNNLIMKQFSWVKFYLPVLVGGLSVIWWLYRIQNSVFPWTAFRDWERWNQYPVDMINFLGMLGFPGILALVGLPRLLRSPNFNNNLIVGWFLAPFVGLILAKFLPVSNSRFLQVAAYIPAAILAEETLKRWGDKRNWGKLIAILLIVAFSIPSFYASLVRQLKWAEENKTNPLIYVPEDSFAALDWLASHGKVDQLVLADDSLNLLIPAFTNKRVVFGHPTFTVNNQVKAGMSQEQLLATNQVDYVVTDQELSFFKFKQIASFGKLKILSH